MTEHEIVQHHNFLAAREEMLDRVRADVARAAGDEKSAFVRHCALWMGESRFAMVEGEFAMVRSCFERMRIRDSWQRLLSHRKQPLSPMLHSPASRGTLTPMSATLETPATQPPAEDIHLDVSHLVTEDDTPVDNPFCEKQMRLLTHPLYASWNPGKPFTVMANVGLYFALNRPPLVPDTLVSLGVSPPENLMLKEHRAYFTWIYGKPPDIVIEIVSNKEGGELDRPKRFLHAQRQFERCAA